VAEKDANAEVDGDEVVGDELPVDDDTRCDSHRATPRGHVAVVEVADVRILERAPAAQQDAPVADLLVAGNRLVEEIEKVIVHRYDALHELDVAHQPRQVVREQLDRRRRADPAGIQRRRVDVPTLHQAEHLARVPADLQRLAVELDHREQIERPHDVADGLAAVASAGRFRPVREFEHARIRLRTIFSQKSTPTRFSWKMLWSNMYSAASPRLTICSPSAGGRTPYAICV
jgi:hypothetical protein